METKLDEGKWLHARLSAAASSIVGLDSAEEGVDWAKEQGFEAYAVDAQSPEAVAALGLEPADVVVAGEIIEHLDAPGPFLCAMRELLEAGGPPRGHDAERLPPAQLPRAGLWQRAHPPDHTAWHSPHTLRNLLERNGWDVEGMAYPEPGSAGGARPRPDRPRTARSVRRLRQAHAVLVRRPRRLGSAGRRPVRPRYNACALGA